MRTEQRNPQPRINQAPKRIGGVEECIPLFMYFPPFSMTAVHRSDSHSQWAQEVMNHRGISASTAENPPCQLIPAAPKQPLQMPHRYVTDVSALSQLQQELPVLRALLGLL